MPLDPEVLEEPHAPSGTLELCLFQRGRAGERPSGSNGEPAWGTPKPEPREERDELWVIQCSSQALGLLPPNRSAK